METLLAIAIVTLVLQLWPSVGRGLLWAIDVRNWNRTTCFVMNLIVVFALVAIRFAPSLVASWQSHRQEALETQAKADKARQARQRRERLEGIKRGRRRRIM